MILWITAIVLLAGLGVMGFYQGAVRGTVSAIGLIVSALLAIPLAFIFRLILPVTGLSHPALLALLAPVCTYLLLIIGFKVAGTAVHKKVEWWYKNKAPDTKRMLWERLNSRVGICLGLVNAALYIILISVVAYVLGYFSVPMASSPNDSVVFKIANSYAQDLQSTRMDKAVAAFVPATEFYYDAVDVLSMIFHTPQLEARLANYPPFLGLAERPEFKDLAKDLKFQEFWRSDPSLTDFRENEKMGKLIGNEEMYTNVVGLVQGDLKDLKAYLETGKSAKYEDEKILGRWQVNSLKPAFEAIKKARPSMNRIEAQRVQIALLIFKEAELTAMVDNKVVLKLGPATSTTKIIQGTWSSTGGGGYSLKLNDGGRNQDVPVSIDGYKLVAKKDGFTLTFDKE